MKHINFKLLNYPFFVLLHKSGPFPPIATYYILTETGDNILTESGDLMILEESI